MFLGFLPLIPAAIGVASAVTSFFGQKSSRKTQKKMQALQAEQMEKEAIALEEDKKFSSQQVMLDFTRAKAQAQQQQWQSIYAAAFKEEQATLAAAQAAAQNGAQLFQVKQQELMANAQSEGERQQTYDALTQETQKAASTQNELQAASDASETQAAMTGQNTSLAAAQRSKGGRMQIEQVGEDSKNYSRDVADELEIQSQYNDRVAALQKELGVSAVEAQAKLDEMGLGYAQMVASYSKTNAKTERKQTVNAAKATKNAGLMNINASTNLQLSRNALQTAQIKGAPLPNADIFGVLGAAGSAFAVAQNYFNPVKPPSQDGYSGSMNIGANLAGRNGMFNLNPNVMNVNRPVSSYNPNAAASTIYSMPPAATNISTYPSTISTYPSTINRMPTTINSYPTTVNTLPPTR